MLKKLLYGFLAAAMLLPGASGANVRAQSSRPDMVNIPGTHQDELGCSGEWNPACENTLLVYDAEDDVWQGTYEIQPGNDDDKKGPRYKAAINGGWGENYGVNAAPGGADIPLVVSEPTMVKFYYDHKTHWIADNFNQKIIVAMGDFQSELGCLKDNDASCLRSWLQDPDGDGLYGVVTSPLKAGTYSVTLTLNEDAQQTIGETQQFTVEKDGNAVYFGYDSASDSLTISTSGAPVGNITKQRAVWVNRDTVLWKINGGSGLKYALMYSADAAMEITPDGLINGTELPLAFTASKLEGDLLKAYPHLSDYAVLKLKGADENLIREMLRGQVAVVARSQSGKDVDATGVQIPGVLDDLYQYEGPLGVDLGGSAPALRVWAPTARAVTLHLFDTVKASYAKKIVMDFDTASGVWSAEGDSSWAGKYYLYEVQTYVPSTGKIENNLVTDPYSISLSMNSVRSQIVDLAGDSLKPVGWNEIEKPSLAAPEDIVLYELHIRDFSISDATVPEEYRGTYKAFTVTDSDGMKHLAKLAEAGLTHIHLLPAFDIASVNEDKSTWQSVDEAELAAQAPDSESQSAAVSAINGTDGFNWGYDPLHYTTPDGSYSTNPEDATRILEFREMVQSLNGQGLRVVMDVVYNHTNASGQGANSVLDRVVPGYYHRLNADGAVEKSTCCENTASEHEMMRKLMIDSVVTWAVQYKVDGFRFDLMGHHMLADMQAVRAALDALTIEKDGVDGKSIYVYGEGWDFGEVANNRRGKNASQLNIGGTGIGVFNDRLRDAVRGGSPFTDPRVQGFATGLLLVPNANESAGADDQLIQLTKYTDWIKLGLAGNLEEFEIIDSAGREIPGRIVGYNGGPAAYTTDPQENIAYVSAHDNQTIFDAVQAKAPAGTSLSDRIRMNNLALSIPMFSQGVPFFHAGDDILRSKSFNPNSYNSGDWYNHIDWSYGSNNWGIGLPPEGSGQWNIYQPLLADPSLKPSKTDIEFASAVFRELLAVRKSSPLFRLQTADQVQKSVSFFNSGEGAEPGLIVMRIEDKDNLDASFKEIVVIFNARPETVTFTDPAFSGKDYNLHPIQAASVDEVVRSAAFDGQAFQLPGRTSAVFVVSEGQPAPTAEPAAAEDSPQFPLSFWIVILAALTALGAAVLALRKKKA